MRKPVKKLYLQDHDLFSHDAKVTDIVTDVDTTTVQLDQTIFHPQGGGQPSDQGTINKIPVTTVVKLGSNIDFEVGHVFSNDNKIEFKVGETVKMEVNKERRIYLSKLHTAGHLISNYVQNMFGHTYSKCHLYPEKGIYLVFAVKATTAPKAEQKDKGGKVKPKQEPPALSKDEITKLTEQCNAAITKDYPVTECTMPDGKRAIKIGDLDPFPCGGTHVKLSEIGEIKIQKVNKKKDELSITFDVSHTARLESKIDKVETDMLQKKEQKASDPQSVKNPTSKKMSFFRFGDVSNPETLPQELRGLDPKSDLYKQRHYQLTYRMF